MTNLTYTKIADKANVRLACARDMMTYTVPVDHKPGDMCIIEAFDAEVFIEAPPAAAKTSSDPAQKKDLETARQELAATIEAAKKLFEESTGTVVGSISVAIMHHKSGFYTDCSMITSVDVSAIYNPTDGRGPTKWTSS